MARRGLHHGTTLRGIKTAMGRNYRLERSRGHSMAKAHGYALAAGKRDARSARIRTTSIMSGWAW